VAPPRPWSRGVVLFGGARRVAAAGERAGAIADLGVPATGSTGQAGTGTGVEIPTSGVAAGVRRVDVGDDGGPVPQLWIRGTEVRCGRCRFVLSRCGRARSSLDGFNGGDEFTQQRGRQVQFHDAAEWAGATDRSRAATGDALEPELPVGVGDGEAPLAPALCRDPRQVRLLADGAPVDAQAGAGLVDRGLERPCAPCAREPDRGYGSMPRSSREQSVAVRGAPRPRSRRGGRAAGGAARQRRHRRRPDLLLGLAVPLGARAGAQAGDHVLGNQVSEPTPGELLGQGPTRFRGGTDTPLDRGSRFGPHDCPVDRAAAKQGEIHR
jgi:hypothetical protein